MNITTSKLTHQNRRGQTIVANNVIPRPNTDYRSNVQFY
jgi:hypothetical protein